MAEGSISTFDFHVQHYGLGGRWAFREAVLTQRTGLGESDSWPRGGILWVYQICFLKYIWRLSFVLTNFFFFSDNTTHPEVSLRQWLCGESISNKPGPELGKQSNVSLKGHPLGSPTLCQCVQRAKRNDSKQHCIPHATRVSRDLNCPSSSAFLFSSLSSKPSVGFHLN